MMKTGRIVRLVVLTPIFFQITACPSGGQSKKTNTPEISITSLGDVGQVETSDVSIRLVGTAESDREIASVSWKNNRGGAGSAAGAEEWSTGPIVLQLGRNAVTITAEDDAGNSNSKEVLIDRETGPFSAPTDSDEPVVMYSYDRNLAHAAPLEGAHVEADSIHVFLVRSEAWEDRKLGKIEYGCCSSEASSETALGRPWRTLIDASGALAGIDRELTLEATFADNSREERTLKFFLASDDKEDNQPPLIAGTPSAGATVGIEYSFLPTATDANGDTLGFSIKNKPRWATFDPLTGRLYGFPSSSDVGRTDDIEISVSDGRTTSTLSRFSIRTAEFTDSAITLSWDPPTERESGAALTDLSGYEIYYSPQSGNLGNVDRIPSASTSRHTIENLQAGDWKFVIVAYDENGNYSEHSNQVSTTIR